MVEREVEVVNRLGLHARAAAKLVHAAGRFGSSVVIDDGAQSVDAKSILGLLLLAAARGSRLTVRCDGPDEEAAAAAVATLFADGFGEER